MSDGPATAATSWEIKLGPLGTRYRLRPDAAAVLTEKFSDVLRHAGEFGETWPSSSGDPCPFLRAMGDFYIMARSSCCTAVRDGGGKISNAKYGRANFVRWAVACLDQQSPDVFSGVTYREIEAILPDEKDHVRRHFDFGDAQLATVRAIADMAFWEVSLWCCLLNAVPDAMLDITHLAGISPKFAVGWRRDREYELHQAANRSRMWPLVLPNAFSAWHQATTDAGSMAT